MFAIDVASPFAYTCHGTHRNGLNSKQVNDTRIAARVVLTGGSEYLWFLILMDDLTRDNSNLQTLAKDVAGHSHPDNQMVVPTAMPNWEGGVNA